MELDNIGASAVRLLSMDIANLTGRLAVMQGVIEDLVMRSNGLRIEQWKADESGTLIPGEDMDVLYGMLHLIRSMN